MNNSLRLFLLSSMVFMIFSCETPVALDIDSEDSKLVLYSLFSTDVQGSEDPIRVEIYESKPILSSDDIVYVDDAEVKIKVTEAEEETLTLELREGLPSYRTSAAPNEGATYDISVSKLGFETVRSRTYVPKGVEIQNPRISSIESKANEFDSEQFVQHKFNLEFEFDDPADEENFYHLYVWMVIPLSEYFEDVSDEYRTIAFGREVETNNPGMIVENGNRVFFGGHLNDQYFNGEKASLNLDMIFNLVTIYSPKDIRIEVELRTVSKDYYKYYTEGSRIARSGDNSFFNEPILISNNIDNGYGVFAGYSRRTERLEFKSE